MTYERNRVGHMFEMSTLTELYELMCDTIVTATEDEVDMVTGTDVHLHDVVAIAHDAGEWEANLKDIWVSRSRWTQLVRQYVDPDRYHDWLNLIVGMGQRGRGQAMLRSKTVESRKAGTGTMRKWGSCMLGWSWKVQPRPTITMFSRTSYLGFIAMLDVTVAYRLAEQAAMACDIDMEDVTFVWHADSVQWHNFRPIGWVFTHGDEWWQEVLFDKEGPAPTPALELNRRFMQDRILRSDRKKLPYGDESYASAARVRRRYHTEVRGYKYAQKYEGGTNLGKSSANAMKPLPQLELDTLTLAPIGVLPGKEVDT